jgi:hypothetical protein
VKAQRPERVKPSVICELLLKMACGIGLASSGRHVTTEARLHFQGSQCGICGERSGTGIGPPPPPAPSPSVFHCIIPPLLHIHSCVIWGLDIEPLSGTQFHMPLLHCNNRTIKRSGDSISTPIYERTVFHVCYTTYSSLPFLQQLLSVIDDRVICAELCINISNKVVYNNKERVLCDSEGSNCLLNSSHHSV